MSDHDSTDPKTEHNSSSGSPRPQRANPPASSGMSRLWILVLIAGLATLGYFLYRLNGQQKQQLQAFEAHAENVSQALELIEKRLDGNAGQIATLESQVQVTMERVGVTQQELVRARTLAQRLEEEQKRNVATLKQDLQRKADEQKVAQLEQESSQKFEGVDREISGVKADVESTRKDLAGTIAELSNLGVKVNEQGQMIATNQTGIDELRRRGERDYVTFALNKDVRTRVAGITLELRDTDGGSAPDADLRIYANDTVVERMDIPQNVSVSFYVGAARIPYELVLNEVTNKPDTCKGYLSVPKDKLPTGPRELLPPAR